MAPEHSLPPGTDTTATRKPRADGVQARERILGAALRLFADKGYASTSVRDIAHAAEANIAAIGYYFGDKAGLYRAALYEPMGDVAAEPPFDAPGLPLETALTRYMHTCLRPLGQGETTQLSVLLRLREAFEPTGMLEDERSARVQMHRRLVAWLAGRLGLAAPDTELEALACAVFALVAYPYYGREKIRQAAPGLFDAPGALDAWVARLARYAAALVAAERSRRDGTDPTPLQHPTATTATTERPT